ncbi:MAG: hypothetical protein HP496_04920 [Nitrospira sp.]|nr:hypothetical protein [Nitrospira sp.]
MTPTEAAAALFNTMPQPLTVSQLEEYGVEASESISSRIAREVLSLNLYWVLAAVEAHIPTKYRAAITESLFESIRNAWWESGSFGTGSWGEYHPELHERRAHYARLTDQEGINPMGICAEAASLMEDHGIISPEDRAKLLVLLIDHTPASEYGRLLEEMR